MEISAEKIFKERTSFAHKTALFQQIMTCYQSRLFHFVLRITHHHEDALDVTQNTFLLAWEKLHQFNGSSKFSTWLFQIAYHESLQWLKKQKRNARMTNYPQRIDLQSTHSVDEQQMLQWLYEAIELLPAKQRAVFALKYFDEKKYEEIHIITGTSVGALKASYHLAVQKIEAYLLSKNHLI